MNGFKFKFEPDFIAYYEDNGRPIRYEKPLGLDPQVIAADIERIVSDYKFSDDQRKQLAFSLSVMARSVMLCSMTRTRDEMRILIGAVRDITGNQPHCLESIPTIRPPSSGSRMVSESLPTHAGDFQAHCSRCREKRLIQASPTCATLPHLIGAAEQITLPMAGNVAAFNLSRTISDRDGVTSAAHGCDCKENRAAND